MTKWIKNTGVKPDCQLVKVIFTDDDLLNLRHESVKSCKTDNLEWSLDVNFPIRQYRVVEN